MTYPIFDIYIYIYILLYDDITRKEGKAHTVWQPRAVASAAEQQNPQRRHLRLGKTARNGGSEMRLGMAFGNASVKKGRRQQAPRESSLQPLLLSVRACVRGCVPACVLARARRGAAWLVHITDSIYSVTSSFVLFCIGSLALYII